MSQCFVEFCAVVLDLSAEKLNGTIPFFFPPSWLAFRLFLIAECKSHLVLAILLGEAGSCFTLVRLAKNINCIVKMFLSTCTKGLLGWTLGKISSLKELSSTGTGCP